jgi:polysaccharide deacetylase family protein (PEP-CTERM system associated)
MNNILSIDFEDWHQLVHRRVTGGLIEPSDHVHHQLDIFLDLLAEYGVHATFFTVGLLAKRYPELVRRIAAAGHEVACHGYEHLLVYRLTPEQFRDDTRRAKQLLEHLAGVEVTGYRAAEFSIRRQSLWALDVLADLGFVYDSSIFPTTHRRYGITGWNPRPACYPLASGRSIVELPLSTLPLLWYRVPVAGGGYFRLVPGSLLLRAVDRLNATGSPLVTYSHPYEFDDRTLSLPDTGLRYSPRQLARAMLFSFHQNLGRGRMRSKFSALLKRFQFVTCREYVHAARLCPSRALFPSHGR